ncbi:methionyl-tRNA formyltransferase [Alphaproteobacteria bacterium]|nr:methionyl-tRNA formyltransferase [Alphaproteobacteria bacterium]
MNKVLSLAYFAGGSKFTLDPFLALKNSKHDLKVIFTKSPKRIGRGKNKTNNLLLDKAVEYGISIKIIDDFKNIENLQLLKSLELDCIVVFSFGLILPKEVLEIPRYGCINIHASLLPKWRGASPVQHALMNNDKITGYTFIIMNEKLDEGKIIYKEKINIDTTDDYGILLQKIISSASKVLVRKIEDLSNNIIKPQKQINSEASYCYKIKKDDTYLKFNISAKEVLGKIKAFSPYPGAKCFMEGELIKILDAKIEDNSKLNKNVGCVIDENLLISCKYGFIRLIKIQRAGRKAMNSREFLNGWKVKKGLTINEKK